MPPKQVKSSTERFIELIAEIESLFKNYVPQDDFVEVMKVFDQKISQFKGEIEDKITETKGNSDTSLSELKTSLDSLTERVSNIKPDENAKKVPEILSTLENIQKQIREEVNTLRSEIPEVPDNSEILHELGERLSKTEELVVGENVRNALETLNGEDRLAMEAIRGLIEELRRIENSVSTGKGMPAPSRGLYFFIDGVKKGLLNSMNFKPGTNMAIAYSTVNGQPTITFNATGGGPGGISVETPTGTVNASNTTFVPSSEPQWVVADGITYYDGAGYTWSSPNIIMDVPPSASIRAII